MCRVNIFTCDFVRSGSVYLRFFSAGSKRRITIDTIMTLCDWMKWDYPRHTLCRIFSPSKPWETRAVALRFVTLRRLDCNTVLGIFTALRRIQGTAVYTRYGAKTFG